MSDELPRMGFGLPVAGPWATPDAMAEIAGRAEALGYASLWTFQRLLGPDARGPAADAEDGNPSALPADHPAFAAVHDAALPLAYVAARTHRIRLGTATVCAPFTPPAVLAKAMTTLDHLSGGRLTVGVGSGWERREFVAAGIPFEGRGARMEEYLRCLHALWTQDPVEFDGAIYSVPRSRNALLPVQRPHPPVLVGGSAPAALRRAGRLAQGWIAGSGQDLGRLEECIGHVRDGAREAGRDPDAVHVLVRVLVDLRDEDPGPGRTAFQGTAEQVRDDLARLRGRGATEVVIDLNLTPHGADKAGDPLEKRAEAERALVALAPPPAV